MVGKSKIQASGVVGFFEIAFFSFVLCVALPVGPLETVFDYVGDPAVEPFHLLFIHYVSFLVLTVALVTLNQILRTTHRSFSFLLFTLSLVALVTDTFFPANLRAGPHLENFLIFPLNLQDSLEIGIWIIMFFLIVQFKRLFRRWVIPLTLLFIFASLSIHVRMSAQLKSQLNAIDQTYSETQTITWAPVKDASAPNIIFIGLDGLSSKEFDQQLKEHPSLIDAFQGFEVYSNAYSEYCETLDSLASLLTSEFFNPVELTAKQRAFSDRSLPVRLKPLGYQSHFIGPYRITKDDAEFWSTQHFLWNFGVPRNSSFFEKAYALQLLHLGWVRFLPNSVAHHVRWSWGFFDARVFETFSLHNFKYLPRKQRLNVVKQFRVLNDSLPQLPPNNQLVFSFSVLVHHPYAFQPNCEPVQSFRSPSLGNRDHSLACALSLTEELLNRIRKQAWYDDSLVIFFSDHGHIREHDRISLAIKPPQRKGPIKFYSDLVRLLDIGDLALQVASQSWATPNGGPSLPTHEQIQVMGCEAGDDSTHPHMIKRDSKDRKGDS